MKTALLAPLYLLALTPALLAAQTPAAATITVSNVAELDAIRMLIGSPAPADAEAVTIEFAAGTYLLKQSVHIARSGVTLLGQAGTVFVLADEVNEPVIAVGTQAAIARPEDTISDILIRSIFIDGNKEHQSSERSLTRPWIRNNGIDVRAVTRLTIEDVTANNNRSGGLVISWGSSDIRVENCRFERNHFDGVAYYASTRVSTVHCTMARNRAAGISLDNAFTDSEFIGCIIDGNYDVGVFARSSKQIRFEDCVVKNSGQWAMFLAHDDAHHRGVFDIMVSSCQVLNNHGGIFVASATEAQSSGTCIRGSVFGGNASGGRTNIQTSGSRILAESSVDLTTAGPALATVRSLGEAL